MAILLTAEIEVKLIVQIIPLQFFLMKLLHLSVSEAASKEQQQNQIKVKESYFFHERSS
jgi:hypothetical protein